MVAVGRFLASERKAARLTLEELAARSGTSASNLSSYERGRREPRISTLDRILRALGRRLRLDSEPIEGITPLTVKDRQSLALHLRVTEKLLADKDDIIRRARASLGRLYELHRSGQSDYYLDTWRELLDGPLIPLIDALTGTGQRDRDLRQASPFAGMLTVDERDQILRDVR